MVTVGAKENLSKEDWIKAGFRALARSGVGAVRAESLARNLKVSKGSFYWHFKDVRAFKESMLHQWQEIGTLGVIQDVSNYASAAEERLRRLVHLAAQSPSSEYGGAGVEMAIREWARFDECALHAVREVDSNRLAFVERLFLDTGVSKTAAKSKSQALYAALLGFELLAKHSDIDLERELDLLLDALL